MRSSCVALFSLFVAACASKSDAPAKLRPPPVVVVTKADTREIAVEIHAPVDLRPLAQADVGAKTLGYLDAGLVDRGDKVKRGQILALVRPSDLPDQLSASRDALAQADASLAQVGGVAVRLGETQITSPLDGYVTVRRLDPGALVGPPGGGAIVSVARVDVLRAFVTVVEREVHLVKVGQEAHVEVDALPSLYTALDRLKKKQPIETDEEHAHA